MPISQDASVMFCQAKSDLLKSYEDEVRAYSDAVVRMREHAATQPPQEEFQVLWDVANRAYQRCEETQQRLQQHIAEHRC